MYTINNNGTGIIDYSGFMILGAIYAIHAKDILSAVITEA
jgi:uncharacterized MnhB-related membrane protein